MKIVSLLLLVATLSLAAQVRAEEPQPVRAKEPKHLAEPPIASSGNVLGISIGMTMKEARAKLAPLRDPEAPRDEKEKYGTRAYWKLRETDFDWIMAWANRDGKITRIRAVLRPDKQKPFGEIGDLSSATTNTLNAVAWNLSGANGAVRISASGSDGRAASIAILAFDPNLPEPPAADDAP